MACGFTGFQLQTDVGRLCASWRLSDDERPKARNKFSGGKNGGTSTLTTAASPSTKTRTLATSIVTLPHPQTAANTNRAKEDAVSQLLLNTTVPSSPFFFADQTKQGQARNLYMGYETWLPVASKVNKPRTLYNAEALAYLGDSIYELYARRHFLFPPLSIDEYNSRVMAVVRCESQDALLKKLQKDDFLTKEESLNCYLCTACTFFRGDVVRWGKNVHSGKSKAVKRVGVSTYKRASSLETLIGYLYLTKPARLE